MSKADQLKQVAPFLRDSKADVRAQAAEILASQLSSAETRAALKGSSEALDAIVKNSVRLTGDVQKVRGKVLTVLVLLSQEAFAAKSESEACRPISSMATLTLTRALNLAPKPRPRRS